MATINSVNKKAIKQSDGWPPKNAVTMRETFFEITFSLFLVYEGAFIVRGFRKDPTLQDASINREGNKAVEFMIMEPWRTKYHWGGIVQSILVAMSFILA